MLISLEKSNSLVNKLKSCKKYKSVNVANSRDEFLKLLKECNDLAKNKKYMDLLDKEAKENDWSEKAKIIIELLRKNERDIKNGKN